MITAQEMKTLERDLLDAYESYLSFRVKFPDAAPEGLFKERIIKRLEELLETAKNIERAAYNRDVVLR